MAKVVVRWRRGLGFEDSGLVRFLVAGLCDSDVGIEEAAAMDAQLWMHGGSGEAELGLCGFRGSDDDELLEFLGSSFNGLKTGTPATG